MNELTFKLTKYATIFLSLVLLVIIAGLVYIQIHTDERVPTLACQLPQGQHDLNQRPCR